MARASLDGCAVDFVHYHLSLRQGEVEGWVAEKRVFEFVDGVVALARHEFRLGQLQSLAHCSAVAVYLTEQIVHVCHIERAVVVGKHRARGAHHRHSSARLVEERGAAEVVGELVYRCDFAGGVNPKRQAGSLRGLHVGEEHEVGVRNLLGRAMPVVVENQRTLVYLRLELLRHEGIVAARGGHRHGVSVGEDAAHEHIGVAGGFYLLAHGFCIVHVEIVVAVVANQVNLVFPNTRRLVFKVVDALIHEEACLGRIVAGEAS